VEGARFRGGRGKPLCARRNQPPWVDLSSLRAGGKMAAEIGAYEEKLALLVGRSCAEVPLTEVGVADTVGCRDRVRPLA
jgi:hypothetical protein